MLKPTASIDNFLLNGWSNKNEGQASKGLSSRYYKGLYLKCSGPGRTMSTQPRIFLPALEVGPGVQRQPAPARLRIPYNVGKVSPVTRGQLMGEQVKMLVSWEEVEPALGLHPNGELWVRVLSTQELKLSNAVLPEEVASQITPEVLAGYNNRTVCGWYPDLRQDDDETIIEWPHEQWWALPKMKVIA